MYSGIIVLRLGSPMSVWLQPSVEKQACGVRDCYCYCENWACGAWVSGGKECGAKVSK